MKKEQFAEMLNGRQYRQEMTKEEESLAKDNGLLVCFGASDDLLEFRGIINDEVGAYEGDTAYLIRKKGGKIDVISDCDLREVMDILNDKEIELDIPRLPVVADWCPSDLECSWLISVGIPHTTFDIMEDGELYCRGIVIEKTDIEKSL